MSCVRMSDELDYRIEAANQAEFVRRYHGHPFVRIPVVVAELSTERADDGVGRRLDLGRVRGGAPTLPPVSAAPGCSSGSRRVPCIATGCSTATRTPATTGSMPTARSRSSTSGS